MLSTHNSKKIVLVFIAFLLVFSNFLSPTKGRLEAQAAEGTSYYLVNDTTNKPMVVPLASWVTVAAGRTAEDLAQFIPNCTNVYRWDTSSQAWIGHPKGTPINNFSLEAGVGYAVSVSANTLVYFTGTQDPISWVNMPKTSQAIDQYHFAIPDSWVGRKAEDLITSIPNANNIYYYNIPGSGWVGHPKGTPINNFTLEKGVSYVVQINGNTVFDPTVTINGSWLTGNWSSCVNGTQTRTVECKISAGGTLSDIYCSNAGTKPATLQSCAVASPQITILNPNSDSKIADTSNTILSSYVLEFQLDQSAEAIFYDNEKQLTSISGRTGVNRYTLSYLQVGLHTIKIKACSFATSLCSEKTMTLEVKASVNTVPLSLSKYTAYSNQNFVKPTTQAKVASFIVSAGSSEGVNINTINISQATSDVMQNMKLMTGSTQLGTTKATLVSGSTTENVFPVSVNLTASESKVIDVYADIKSSASVTSFALVVDLLGTSAMTATAVTVSDQTMQTMTLAGSSLTSAVDSSQPISGIVIAGTTVKMNAIKFTASGEAYTITKVRILESTASNYDSISKVILEYKDKSGNAVTKEGYLNASGIVDFSGLNMYVPKDSAAVLTVKAEIATIASGADSGDTPGLDFIASANFYALGESSNVAKTSGLSDVIGKDMVVRESSSITYAWSTGDWSSCVDNLKTRAVTCSNSSGAIVIDNYCADIVTAKPASTEACTTSTYTWVVSWSTCTNGWKTKVVECKNNSSATVADSYCSTTTKPVVSMETQNCATEENKLSKRLSGKFLLAVESNGRIYYINPKDLKKYEVTFGNVMQLFKDLALGINSGDLNKIPIHQDSVSDQVDSDGDGFSDKKEVATGHNPFIASDPNNRGNDKMSLSATTANRLKGKLLLQVDDHGRIWYVDQTGQRWEVTWGNVMNLFTKLALGITNSDLEQIPSGN